MAEVPTMTGKDPQIKNQMRQAKDRQPSYQQPFVECPAEQPGYRINDVLRDQAYFPKKVGSTLRTNFRCRTGRAEINQKTLGKEKIFNQVLYLRQRIFSRVELIVSCKGLGHVPSPVKHF